MTKAIRMNMLLEPLVTSANAGEGDNQLHTELDRDSGVTSESMTTVVRCREGCLFYWWFSGAPGSPQHYVQTKR